MGIVTKAIEYFIIECIHISNILHCLNPFAQGLIRIINERMINLCNTNIRLHSIKDTSHDRLPLNADGQK